MTSSSVKKVAYACFLVITSAILFRFGQTFFTGHRTINSCLLVLAFLGIFGRGMASIKEFAGNVALNLLSSIILVGGFLLITLCVVYFFIFA
jgi:hypothetical protein